MGMGYENQIPSELLRRILLCSSKPGDWVGDPFSGSFSTARTALNLGRRAWGCDINPEVSKFWPNKLDWQPRKEDVNLGNVDSDRYDEILKFITKNKLDDALFKLLIDADEEQLKKAIGPTNGSRIFHLLNKSSIVDIVHVDTCVRRSAQSIRKGLTTGPTSSGIENPFGYALFA